jgi:2-succinyl-5-enolpyruvyl-6-hydroxy-3-cyclohexene-1-carboxylate synthase
LGFARAATEPVVGLVGDLSMLHDQNGLLADRHPDCVFVIVNNNGGGIFSFLPQSQFPNDFERMFGTPHGRNFEWLAALHDVGYSRIEAPDSIVEAVSGAQAAGGVQLVEVRVDRTSNVAVHDRITRLVLESLDGV